MNLINGKQIADSLLFELKQRISQLKIRPCLAVILVGDNSVSQLYVNIKEKRAKEIGINFKKILMSEKSSQQEIIDVIHDLNKDQAINGIMLQLPLPENQPADKIIQEIDLNKDVDGLRKDSAYVSPFILALWQSLKSTQVELKNKQIIALVNSKLFGQRLKKFFNSQKISLEYSVQPKDFSLLIQADIVITALGRPRIIKKSMIKPGIILIDGGVGKEKDQLFGDVDQEDVQEKASWLTPIPRGVGPLTVFFLLNNLYLSVK